MPQIDFTQPLTNEFKDYLQQLTKKNKPLRHNNYYSNVEHRDAMSVHINGDRPDKLLNDWRPNEPKASHDYRLEIYQPITKSEAKKAINVINRIANPKNYSIIWPEDVPKTIPADETLEVYTNENYPFFKNIQEWLFKVALKSDLVDPNAVAAFHPINIDEIKENPSVFAKPFGHIFDSDQIIDFVSDEYYVFWLYETNPFKDGDKTREGIILHIFTKNEIVEIKEIGRKQSEIIWQKEVIYFHGLDRLPIVPLGGEYINGSFPISYESFMAGILPFWNEVVRVFSDYQAQMVLHMYLERVEMEIECTDCSDVTQGVPRGQVLEYTVDEEPRQVPCKTCSGSGTITGRSPYGVTKVRPQQFDQIVGAFPDLNFPGVAYIEKPVEILKESRKEIERQTKSGFSAINMDIVNEVGENQSGVAKVIDRTDLDEFLKTISMNTFRILNESYEIIALYRYKEMGVDLNDVLPKIVEPTNFSVLSVPQLIEELARAKEAGLNDTIIGKMEDELVDKKFNNPELTLFNKKAISLDPLSGKSDDEKMAILTNKGITQIDYIVSSQIQNLMLMAKEQDPEFLFKERSEQQEKLRELAKSVMPEQTQQIPLVDGE